MSSRLYLPALCAALLGCDAASTPPATCGVEGVTQLCHCAGAVEGAQACQADGTWSTCDCADPAPVDVGDEIDDDESTLQTVLGGPCQHLIGATEAEVLAGDAVLLGAILPLSGGLEDFGVGMQRAAQLAHDDAVATGTLPATALLTCDSESGAPAAVTSAAHLVAQGVPAAVGPALSIGLLDVWAQAAEEAQLALVSPSATSPLITELDDDGLVWRTVASDALVGEAIGHYLADEGAERVGLLVRDDAWGQGVRDALLDVLCADDPGACEPDRMVAVEVPPGTTAVSMAALEALDPELVVVITYSDAIIPIDMVEAATDARLVLAQGILAADDLVTLDDDTVCRTIGFTMAPPSGPGWDAFEMAYLAAWGEEPPPFSANTYDAARVLFDGTALATSLDGPGIAATFGEVVAGKEDWASGTLSFDVAIGEPRTPVEAFRFVGDERVSLGVTLDADATWTAPDDSYATAPTCE